jgi:2-polyprenyl-3-methyl-5-hydroxy-6-metoxy-1,4-benzoquinol methylase/8-oxo-dGTP pyrophosphatase MutT (NUDIX family)
MPEEPPTSVPVFGTRVEGCPYVVRPSAYALVRNGGGDLAVIRTPRGSYLPGGGVEANETPEQTVQREAKEESGLILKLRASLGRAVEIVYSAEENVCFEKRCLFVEAEIIGQVLANERDHELIWADPDRAISLLSHESHRWAVRHYLQADASQYREDSSTRSWDAIADDWVTHADKNDYRIYYLMPRMFTMLGNVEGKRILDLGCGEGGYARELNRRGAHATGVDGSERLIEVARQRAHAEGVKVRYLHANASALNGIESSWFNVVVASMSLMDVENYEAAIREVCRVLCGGGELVMSITHPCFSAPVSEWIRDGDGGLQAFAVDRYFERVAWETMITPAFRVPVLRRHRPLEDYMLAPLENGLRLREFREPSVTTEELQHSRRFRKLSRIPYFLFMRWQKP